jgi:hypothetical protein
VLALSDELARLGYAVAVAALITARSAWHADMVIDGNEIWDNRLDGIFADSARHRRRYYREQGSL